MISDAYIDAKNRMLSGDLTVEKYFEQNSFMLESAYCKLLSGDIESANDGFVKLAESDFRADWGRKLVQCIKCTVYEAPSYFQVRNFLEIDLNLLIKVGQAEFIDNIIGYANIFYSVNPESYKFIARVMYYNDFIEVALFFLKKSREKLYNDPELHYMLANCYLIMGQVTQARAALKTCLGILPNYFPAKRLLAKLP